MGEIKKDLEDWINQHGLKDKYRIRVKKDAFLGEMIELYSVYNNGTEHLELKTNSIEAVKQNIKEREEF